VENENCAEHWHVPVNKLESLAKSNLISAATASGSSQSSFNLYDVSSNDEEYLTYHNVAATTPGRSDAAARYLTATSLYLNLPPEAPKKGRQIDPTLNNYHPDPMEISSLLWIPDTTNWWRQQEETHWKYTDLSNVAYDIFPIILPGIRVNSSFSFGRHVIGWW